MKLPLDGMPCASTMTWCLLPALPRSTGGGRWPVRSSSLGCDWSRLRHGKVQQVRGAQFGEQQFVRAHSPSSISHGFAVVFLVSAGSPPFAQHQRGLTCRHYDSSEASF